MLSGDWSLAASALFERLDDRVEAGLERDDEECLLAGVELEHVSGRDLRRVCDVGDGRGVVAAAGELLQRRGGDEGRRASAVERIELRVVAI